MISDPLQGSNIYVVFGLAFEVLFIIRTKKGSFSETNQYLIFLHCSKHKNKKAYLANSIQYTLVSIDITLINVVYKLILHINTNMYK